MKTIKVGNRDVSALILGTDYFGTRLSREESFALMDRYFELGGNALDSARLYASWLPNGVGASELTIGAWMKERKNRDEVYLITKGGAPPKALPGKGRLHPEELRYDIEESLKALQVDCVDMYFLHRDNDDLPVELIIDTLGEFYKEGKIKAIGASNWKGERISEANKYAAKAGLPGFTASEIQWSLAQSTPEAQNDMSLICMNEEEYFYYLTADIPVFAFSSQAKGFFIRGIESGLQSNNAKALDRFVTPENLARLERVRELMKVKNMTAAEISLGYITSNRFVSSALIGCKSISQLEDSMKASDITLTPGDIAYLAGNGIY